MSVDTLNGTGDVTAIIPPNRVSLGAPALREFDLFGRVFSSRPLTRSLEVQRDQLGIELGSETSNDSVVEKLGAFLDVFLTVPAGKRKRPSELLVEHWQADKVTVDQLGALIEAVLELDDRPT